MEHDTRLKAQVFLRAAKIIKGGRVMSCLYEMM